MPAPALQAPSSGLPSFLPSYWQISLMSAPSPCHAGDFWRPYFLYVGLSALYALFAAGVVAFWAPEAAGSGMPEIKVSAQRSAQADRADACIAEA